MNLLTVNEGVLKCQRTGTIEIKIENLNSVKLTVEVMDGNCWGLTSSI